MILEEKNGKLERENLVRTEVKEFDYLI